MIADLVNDWHDVITFALVVCVVTMPVLAVVGALRYRSE